MADNQMSSGGNPVTLLQALQTKVTQHELQALKVPSSAAGVTAPDGIMVQRNSAGTAASAISSGMDLFNVLVARCCQYSEDPLTD